MKQGRADIDHVTQAFASWVFDLPQNATVDATYQYMRTQVHPDLYATVTALEEALEHGGPALLRHVVERVEEHPRAHLVKHAHHPVPRSLQRILHEYEAGITDRIPEVRRLVSLIAATHRGALSDVVGEIVSYQTRKRLSERLRAQAHRPDLLLREWHQMGREADQLRQERHPESVRQIVPLPMVVQQTDGPQPYIFNASIRVTDPVRQETDVHLHDPRIADQVTVEEVVLLPWAEAAEHGVVLEFELPSQTPGLQVRHTIYLSTQELIAIRERGSAVTTAIGHGAHIPVHMDHLVDGITSEQPRLPPHPLATVRVKESSVEIRRTAPETRLTVFL